MLQKTVQAATGLGLGSLETLMPVDSEDPACLFLRRNGFEAVAVISEFDADTEAMLAAVAPVYRRLVARGKVPRGAELVPIEQSPVPEVRRLVLEHLPRLEDELEPDLRRYAGTASRALLLNGDLVGAMLVRPLGSMVFWDANVVAPAKRNTWASTCLKNEVFSAVLAAGATRIRFRTNEAIHPDTAKLARRVAADLQKRMVHFERKLVDPAAPSPDSSPVGSGDS